MDWTGGTRRRYAGAKNNNAGLQRQKAHFARVRAAKQNSHIKDRQRTISWNGHKLSLDEDKSNVKDDRSLRVSQPQTHAKRHEHGTAHSDDTAAWPYKSMTVCFCKITVISFH